MSTAAAIAASASPSVGELTTDVNCTVEHLKELGKRIEVVERIGISSRSSLVPRLLQEGDYSDLERGNEANIH